MCKSGFRRIKTPPHLWVDTHDQYGDFLPMNTHDREPSTTTPYEWPNFLPNGDQIVTSTPKSDENERILVGCRSQCKAKIEHGVQE